jgi:hypothetical protein
MAMDVRLISYSFDNPLARCYAYPKDMYPDRFVNLKLLLNSVAFSHAFPRLL